MERKWITAQREFGKVNVWLKVDPEIRGTGKNSDEAVGNMVLGNFEIFGYVLESIPPVTQLNKSAGQV